MHVQAHAVDSLGCLHHVLWVPLAYLPQHFLQLKLGHLDFRSISRDVTQHHLIHHGSYRAHLELPLLTLLSLCFSAQVFQY